MDTRQRFYAINTLLGGNLHHFIEEGGYIKLFCKPLMDLSIEAISIDTISMTHYFKLNGDLIADPDMEIKIDLHNGTAEAMTYQDTMIYQSVLDHEQVDTRLQEQLNDFLGTWLTQLSMHGYKYENRL